MEISKLQVLLLSAAMLGLAGCSGSVRDDARQGGRPSGPPSEAFAACEGKAAGDVVTFSGRRGETLEATCKERNGQLVAMPANAPERRRN